MFNNKEKMGVIDYIANTITIDEKWNKQMQYRTLWHELVHGMIWHYAFKTDHDDEEEIERMANAIVQVIRDNKKCQ